MLKYDTFFAVSALGSEELTASELEALGAENIEIEKSGVRFDAPAGGIDAGRELLYKANLWLRTGLRILTPIKTFSALHPPMLYDQIRRIPWEDVLSPQMTLAVDVTIVPSRTVPSKITHSQFAAQKIKDAIVDRMREELGSRSNVDPKDPDVQVHAYFKDGKCTVSLDSSGASLHERGYRTRLVEAPLKETLAATIVGLTGWNGDVPFYDPMCGSGTLVIEALGIAMNLPAGRTRKKFGFQRWKDFSRPIWEKVLNDAGQKKQALKSPVFGSDLNPRVVELAKMHAQQAGLTAKAEFAVGDFFTRPAPAPKGVLVMNPPYGERLGSTEHSGGEILNSFYASIGDRLKKEYKGWTAYIFTGNPEAAKHVGLKPARRIPLFNGPIDCRLLKFDLY